MVRPLRGSRSLLCAPFALAVAGCVASVPEVSPEADVALATGADVEIVFRYEGAPPDAPPAGLPPAASADRLTGRDALVRALGTSAELQAALARVRIARAEAEQARLLPNPVLEFVVRWGDNPLQLEGSFAQSLLALLQRPRKAGAADDRLRAAAADALTVALDEAAGLRACYVEAQVQQQRVLLLRRRRTLAERGVALVDSRLAHGEGTSLEQSVAVAAQLDVEREVVDAEQRLRALQLQLARRIGEPSSAANWQLDAWSATAAVDVAEPSEEAWLRRALDRRPELQSLRWQLSALGDEHALALWGPWQDLAIGANVQRAPTWVAGPVLSVPLPIFDRGEAAAAAVTAEQAEVRHRLTDAMRRTIERVRAAFAAAQTQRAQLRRVRGELLPMLEQRLARVRAAERAGEASALASLRAEAALADAVAAALTLDHDVAQALLRLERAAAGAPLAARDDLPTDSPTSGHVEEL